MGAAEGGCCTPGALCHVARRNGRSRGRLLHSWGAFFGLVQRKRPRPRKEIRFATVSHDPATTQPGTVSYRAERTCVSAQPSSADACNVGIRCSDDVMLQHIPRKGRRGRRPLQSVCAAQPTYTHHPSAVREASLRMSMLKYPLTKFPFPVC